MKSLLMACFLFTGSVSFSQNIVNKVYYFPKDSLPNDLIEKWKYFPGDSMSMAARGYNDSSWQELETKLDLSSIDKGTFKGIAWFRFHFRVDPDLIGKPLAVNLKHYGASEVYMDGKFLNKYGVIKDSANCIYKDPQEFPIFFILSDTGIHVLAIRYANFNAFHNHSVYKIKSAGFNAIIGKAEDLALKKDFRTLVVTFIFILLMGIFLVLSILHLLLFLFYPAVRSNLFFSLFMFCLSSLSLIGFFSLVSESPTLQMSGFYLLNPLFCTGAVSLSIFINELFSKKKGIRFWVILGIGVVSILMRILGMKIYILFTAGLLISVSIEAVFIIISAIIKKVKGAKIIGSGILIFSLFFITIFSLVIAHGGNYDINDSTPEGLIILLFLALAILSVPLSMSVYLAWSFANINKNLASQVDQIKMLSEKTIEQEQEKVKLISGQNEMLEQKVEERTHELKLEKKKSDDLLLNILPGEIAEELKQKGKSDAHLYDQVSVLFTDFVSFTTISEKLSPKDLVDEIHLCFTAFDEIIGRNGLEKIKTIGDAYMAVCGMPNSDAEHAEKCVKAAQEILAFVQKRKMEGGEFDIRIGINSGSVVAGIVGVKKFAYDIWGDTVNTAARMEQNSESGKINISGSTYELIKDKFSCIYRGKINAKNKGDIDMYFVDITL